MHWPELRPQTRVSGLRLTLSNAMRVVTQVALTGMRVVTQDFNGLFPSGFPTNTLCTPLTSTIRATCPAHLILDLTTRTILGEEYRLRADNLTTFMCQLS
jgi:hypothetical protein